MIISGVYRRSKRFVKTVPAVDKILKPTNHYSLVTPGFTMVAIPSASRHSQYSIYSCSRHVLAFQSPPQIEARDR